MRNDAIKNAQDLGGTASTERPPLGGSFTGDREKKGKKLRFILSQDRAEATYTNFRVVHFFQYVISLLISANVVEEARTERGVNFNHLMAAIPLVSSVRYVGKSWREEAKSSRSSQDKVHCSGASGRRSLCSQPEGRFRLRRLSKMALKGRI